LFFNLRELEIKKIQFDQRYAAGEINFDSSQLTQTGPLHTVGTAELLSNTLGEIRVKGHLTAQFDVPCDRCLDPTRFNIDQDFDLFYRPAPEVEETPHEIAIDAGESEIGFYEGPGIELEEILREYVLLTMPMRQICRPDCAGICSRCGQNKNAGSCSCVHETVNDRWAALRAWKENTAQVREKR
jgi:uncharacterized protein